MGGPVLLLAAADRAPRIARKPMEYGGRWHHVVNAREADEVDDLVKSWLTDAFQLEAG